MIKYGAKTINTGGYWTMPKLYSDGVMLVGDSASFLNGQRIKGIHTAMKSGMLAAETIILAFASNDFTTDTLHHYHESVRMSWIYDELFPVRNFHAAFQRGRWSALVKTLDRLSLFHIAQWDIAPNSADALIAISIYHQLNAVPLVSVRHWSEHRQAEHARHLAAHLAAGSVA